jgi:NHL repeat
MIAGEMPLDKVGSAARADVPELPPSLHWVNIRGSVRLAGLRGHIVLLFFWSADSVYSIESLAELLELGKRHPGALAMVGVHTPKYPEQQTDQAVLKAVHRNHLRMPVANDAHWLAWRQFGIGAWPTVLLIDAAGHLAARLVGAHRDAELDDAIARLREESAADEQAGEAPTRRNIRAEPRTTLSFPAHVLATDSRMYVSDTGHHRVLECTHDGRVLRQFGSGTAGNWDGQLAGSGFNGPEGLALGGDSLYVADTGNHCVRRVRLDSGDVQTMLGTGRTGPHDGEGDPAGPRVPIDSPRAVAVDGDALYVAAAGRHQILRADLRDHAVNVVAGSGWPGVRDGIGGQSRLEQPSALALLTGQLLIAGAAGNAIQRLRLSDLALNTLAGASSWEFGDRDGPGAEARFAYPSGLAASGKQVFVADTYNNRLRTLNPFTGETGTLAIDRELHEPQGLSFAAGSLWVADRNDHAILRVDPESRVATRVAVDE